MFNRKQFSLPAMKIMTGNFYKSWENWKIVKRYQNTNLYNFKYIFFNLIWFPKCYVNIIFFSVRLNNN